MIPIKFFLIAFGMYIETCVLPFPGDLILPSSFCSLSWGIGKGGLKGFVVFNPAFSSPLYNEMNIVVGHIGFVLGTHHYLGLFVMTCVIMQVARVSVPGARSTPLAMAIFREGLITSTLS